jgi:hypothetical protein
MQFILNETSGEGRDIFEKVLNRHGTNIPSISSGSGKSLLKLAPSRPGARYKDLVEALADIRLAERAITTLHPEIQEAVSEEIGRKLEEMQTCVHRVTTRNRRAQSPKRVDRLA